MTKGFIDRGTYRGWVLKTDRAGYTHCDHKKEPSRSFVIPLLKLEGKDCVAPLSLIRDTINFVTNTDAGADNFFSALKDKEINIQPTKAEWAELDRIHSQMEE